MLRRNRNESRSRRSSKKKIQKRVVHSKHLTENICKICKKQQTLGLCLGKHKHNVHNQSLKTSKCITCGRQFLKRSFLALRKTMNDDRVSTSKIVKTVGTTATFLDYFSISQQSKTCLHFKNCLACRKKRLAKEKIIMRRKIMKLVQKTEILLGKCASATNTETMADFLQTVQVRLSVLRQNLNVLNAVNEL